MPLKEDKLERMLNQTLFGLWGIRTDHTGEVATLARQAFRSGWVGSAFPMREHRCTPVGELLQKTRREGARLRTEWGL